MGRSLAPQPPQRPAAPVQFSRRHEGWLFQPRGALLQSTPTFHSRFAPYNNPQGCFSGPLNSSPLAETHSHFQVQQNLYPVTYTEQRRIPVCVSGTYAVSLVNPIT